jgi:hypothetical protein
MQKSLKTKISIPFTILFHKTLHSHYYFFSHKNVFQKSQTHTYILIKRKLNKKFPKILHITYHVIQHAY